MKRKVNFKKIFGIAVPVLVAGVMALVDELGAVQMEDEMEDMRNRISELEKKNTEEEAQ